MTTGAPDFQRTFPLRKPTTTGDESEYYGVPLQVGRELPVKKQRHFSSSGSMARSGKQSIQLSGNPTQDEGIYPTPHCGFVTIMLVHQKLAILLWMSMTLCSSFLNHAGLTSVRATTSAI